MNYERRVNKEILNKLLEVAKVREIVRAVDCSESTIYKLKNGGLKTIKDESLRIRLVTFAKSKGINATMDTFFPFEDAA